MNANVPLARKLILHSPVSNEAALASFVERCLEDGVSLIAIVARVRWSSRAKSTR